MFANMPTLQLSSSPQLTSKLYLTNSSTITVSREGDFSRSGPEEADETEVFQGEENTLTMNQTYSKEFQCLYMLQRYPFDTQVFFSFPHHCNGFSRRSVELI